MKTVTPILMTLFIASLALGCGPMGDEESFGGGSSLMGVASEGRSPISGNLSEALNGYIGQVRGGIAYVGGGYGGAGLAGQMHCRVGNDENAWLANCDNVTTQGFLAPGQTFQTNGGQSLWSWTESTERILRILGNTPQLRPNENLSSSSAHGSGENASGENFENLFNSNSSYFANLDQGSIVGEYYSSQDGSGFSLTNSSLKNRPVFEEYSASKMTSLKCQVGSKGATYNDVVEVILRKGGAVLNAYFAKGLGYVGYKYVRSGQGGGSGTNILVCLDPKPMN